MSDFGANIFDDQPRKRRTAGHGERAAEPADAADQPDAAPTLPAPDAAAAAAPAAPAKRSRRGGRNRRPDAATAEPAAVPPTEPPSEVAASAPPEPVAAPVAPQDVPERDHAAATWHDEPVAAPAGRWAPTNADADEPAAERDDVATPRGDVDPLPRRERGRRGRRGRGRGRDERGERTEHLDRSDRGERERPADRGEREGRDDRAPRSPAVAPRSVALLVDVAALAAEARDYGGELALQRLRQELAGGRIVTRAIAVLPQRRPTPAGFQAVVVDRPDGDDLAAAAFALAEVADGVALAPPTDAMRRLAELLAEAGHAVELAGFGPANDADRTWRRLGRECLFVP